MNKYTRTLLLVLTIFLSISDLQAANFHAGTGHDFQVKGFHLDLRIQVMKPAALKQFARKLSEAGINTLVMEYEASFPFEQHPLIPNRYAYTKAEIADFVKYCSGLGIDVIPLQQTFGHVEYILRYPRYAALRESDKDFSQVNPTKEALCRQLFKELITEMASLHPSKYFHIGCDETRLLGHSAASKAKVKKYGVGRLYGDYVKMICDIVLELGKIPVLWADIALKYPEALQSLPKEAILVDWNYGWDLNRFGDHQKLMASGFEIWGAPSLRSSPDNYNLTTWDRHFNNIHDFIPQARQLGYKGIIMTSWSTSGLYSYLHESGPDIIELYAIRRVYPITGFNLLLEAYFKAIGQQEPLDINRFVQAYTKKHYGFSPEQSDRFLDALMTVPYQLGHGKVNGQKNLSIKNMLDSVRHAGQVLDALQPLRNLGEFTHYRLMARTRVLYMEFQYIAEQASLPAAPKGLTNQLKNLIAKCQQLNADYIKANEDSFYASELAVDNETRIAKMKQLYNRLARVR
ncbi:hypothetical protein GCM10027051_25060 [Niabella terrae]